jgi:VIT1/CCC1 family predicted Fe2+/Mn2+ transporter
MEQESSLAIELKGEYNHEEHHVTVGEYLKSLVYGGLDGLVNTLSVIVGGFGSGATTHNIMAVGVSVMVGDGIGMALGDYLSSKS